MRQLDRAPFGSQLPAPTCAPDHALTRRQTLLWLDAQLYPNTPYHHVVLCVTLRGALDVSRFQAAYAVALSAFDQFRLVFEELEGEPRQRLAGVLDPTLPLHTLGDEPDACARFVRERAARPFDFGRALFDAVLLRLADDHHVFYFCQHHIISDGTSVGLLLDALAQAYRGAPIAQHPSYLRYLHHERAYRESPRAARDAAHFQQRLGQEMPALSLYGRTRVARSFGVDRSQLALGTERSARLRQLAADGRIALLDPGFSLLVTLATLVFAYVHRVSGTRRLLLATPLPNRPAELATTGGLLMEQTFLCVEIDEDERFDSLAAKVRGELFDALRHAKHCASDRGLAYVSLNLLRIPAVNLPGLEAEVALSPLASLIEDGAAAPGDLRDSFGVSLIGFDDEQPLTLAFDFHRATFDAALRTRAKAHFLSLCDAMLRDLETPIAGVELVSAAERTELLLHGRGLEPRGPAPDLLQQLGHVARARALEPALLHQGESIQYRELVVRVGKLAARLAQLGVRPGVRVAFCLPRGFDEPLLMLATLAAGGAYVPLDSSHPEARLQLILEDAAAEVLVTQRAFLSLLKPPPRTRVVLLDEERAAIEALAPLALGAPAQPEQAAYVLFTSGSTGRPKGVEVPRCALANFLRSMAHTPGLSCHDRLLAVTTVTFDIAGLELFLPLWVGATVAIADRETVLDARRMLGALERDAISVLQATPTTFRLLLEAGFARGAGLKLLCGGEPLSAELAERLLATGAELWNMYGPTETTVWSTLAKLALGGGQVPIGRPIDATQVYVLDAGGSLAPEGVPGELCIGGAGLALGYLGRPDLTGERFVQNPYAAPGERVYRTGDLARFLPSGALACLGRLDQQVKIRGFRIELGEIESCLRQLAGVREVVVEARALPGSEGPGSDSAERSLVAYWVGEPDLLPSLRAKAQRDLPSYMQPVAYVQLPELPRNPHGKLDRARLPAPPRPDPCETTAEVFGDALEERMAGLFRAALGGRALGPEQDFFALGGDSVRAIALRRSIHQTFHVELPLQVMFERPTVRGLVDALTAHGERAAPLFLELRQGRADRAPLICVMGIALYRDLAQALDTDRAVYAAHVPLDPSAGDTRSVEAIAQRYTRLILERVPGGPYHLVGLCFGGLVAFEIAHQLIARGHEVATLAIVDGLLPGGARYAPLDHARALLLRPRSVLQRAKERLARLGQHVAGPAPEPEPELLLRAALTGRLTRRYVAHARRLPIPFTLFRATEREEAPWYRLRHTLGWDELSTTLAVQDVKGTHLSILQADQVAPIARTLHAALGPRA